VHALFQYCVLEGAKQNAEIQVAFEDKYLLNCGIQANFHIQVSSGLETPWSQDLQMPLVNFRS